MPGKKLNGFSRTPAGVFVNCEGNSIAPRSLSPWRTQLPIFKTSARGGVEDGVCVEAVDAIEVGQVARLAEMLDAKRVDAMPCHGAEPGQRRRVAVEHGDERGVLAERRQQALDLALRAA